MSRQGSPSQGHVTPRKSAARSVTMQQVTKGRDVFPNEMPTNIPALILPPVVKTKKNKSDMDCLLEGALSLFCGCVCSKDSSSESESDDAPALTCDLVF